MKMLALAAILAALALPMHAQEASTSSPARAGKSTPSTDEARTPREKARLAKAQNKDAKCAPTPKQKKAAAT